MAFTYNTDQSIQGITSLGYPVYFVFILAVFKVLGSIALIVPQVPARVKEWAYAGFAIDFIAAFVSLWVVTGFTSMLWIPVATMVVLVVSYLSREKLKTSR